MADEPQLPLSSLRSFVHDLRNPMSAVMTASYLLRDPQKIDCNDLPALCEVIDKEMKRMNDLISDFEKNVTQK